MQYRNSKPITAVYAMLIAPIIYLTNVIFGKIGSDTGPFLLAFIRWSIVGIILFGLCKSSWQPMLTLLREQWKLLFAQGFFGMFGGGLVYFALHETSATNGILIYTSPPVMVLLVEHLRGKHRLTFRQVAGAFTAIFGVLIVLTKGELSNLKNLDNLNKGDVIFIIAAICWAAYSVILKTPQTV